ncbi:hypothetical protein AB0K04_06900 [Micromonospora coxensis]|uniref:hypothetical protein n=1 Tax=Micromonospora coxensis TaxID=356852 RepID=UPI00342E19D5
MNKMLKSEEYARGVAAARVVYEGNQEIDDVIAAMKQSGFNVIESIKGLMEVTGMPLAEAQPLVHFSDSYPELHQ